MKKVKELLKLQGKTQTWLAGELGMPRQRLWNMLEQKDISLTVAFKIADALGVDVNEFRKG